MIYTFYSYKGGVGRSMAMANVAEWLHMQGKEVIIVDWDLEAPGLESYFFREDELNEVRSNRGLLDILLDYKSRYVKLNREIIRSTQEIETVFQTLMSKLSDYELRWDEAIKKELDANSIPPTVLNETSELDIIWSTIRIMLFTYAAFKKEDIEGIITEFTKLNETKKFNTSTIAGIIGSKLDNQELVDKFSIYVCDKSQSGMLDLEEMEIYLSTYALLEYKTVNVLVEELKSLFLNKYSGQNKREIVTVETTPAIEGVSINNILPHSYDEAEFQFDDDHLAESHAIKETNDNKLIN
ncbi:MAG: hypothetical protein WKF89_06715 [Chitinophagaceae bacterium]